MMNKYKILLPIETASRELIYKMALAVRFANIGYECYIGSKSVIWDLIKKLKPFVYFDKGYHKEISEQIYNTIKSNGGFIISLDEEGGVDYNDFSTISSRYPEKIFDIIDLIFLWGNAQYHFLKSNRTKFKDENIIVSGHPRFELLKKSYHGLYEKQVELIRNKYGKYILFNTNMGFGNNIRGDEFVVKNYGSRIKNINEVIAYDKLKIKSYISLIKKLSSLVDCNIILRPHPEEEIVIYNEAFQQLSNVKVIYEGSVIPWILGSEIMIHPDCTTGIESAMLGKKSISYLPNSNDTLVTYLPVELSYKFDNEEKMVEFMINKNYLKDSIEGINPLLNNYFSFESDSTQIIIDKLDHFLIKLKFRSSKDINFLYILRNRFIQILKEVYYNFFKEQYALSKNKLNGFNAISVNAIYNELKSVLNIRDNIKIKELYRNLYKIYSF